jgi:hypothetical protein
MQLAEEDAFNFIVKCVREKKDIGHYGYQLYIPDVIRQYLILIKADRHEEDRNTQILSPVFYAAAWNLCRRGVLRPGIKKYLEQSTSDGNAGNGYSITPLGEEWFQKEAQYDFIPLEPGRFARLLDDCGDKFGIGFRERCQEAIRCYNGLAYIACCAMCGAAAESIILALAIAKSGDEEKVLKDYLSSGGRGRIENLIINQKPQQIQNEFRGYSSLLKYWRDAASHGKESGITDNEAYTSLAFILRFALFTNDRWDVLTK